MFFDCQLKQKEPVVASLAINSLKPPVYWRQTLSWSSLADDSDIVTGQQRLHFRSYGKTWLLKRIDSQGRDHWFFLFELTIEEHQALLAISERLRQITNQYGQHYSDKSQLKNLISHIRTLDDPSSLTSSDKPFIICHEVKTANRGDTPCMVAQKLGVKAKLTTINCSQLAGCSFEAVRDYTLTSLLTDSDLTVTASLVVDKIIAITDTLRKDGASTLVNDDLEAKLAGIITTSLAADSSQ